MLDCEVLWSNSAAPVPPRTILIEWVAQEEHFNSDENEFLLTLSWRLSESCHVESLEPIFRPSWCARVGGLTLTFDPDPNPLGGEHILQLVMSWIFDASWFDESAASNHCLTTSEIKTARETWCGSTSSQERAKIKWTTEEWKYGESGSPSGIWWMAFRLFWLLASKIHR